MKEKPCQPVFLYSSKISLKNKNKIKTLRCTTERVYQQHTSGIRKIKGSQHMGKYKILSFPYLKVSLKDNWRFKAKIKNNIRWDLQHMQM